MKKILAADIGGTNSRFSYFQIDDGGVLHLVHVTWLPTAGFSSFEQLMHSLQESDFALEPAEADAAVVAVAGPVEHGTKSSPPFISWDIDISAAGKALGLKKAVLINDFVAQAYACKSPIGEQADMVKAGIAVDDAASAVIGAGTALGKAFIIPDGSGGYSAMPSEGGHASFPFTSSEENGFQQFMLRKTGDSYITWNKVISGSGLSCIHEFLTGSVLSPKDVVAALSESQETFQWGARLYGRACRDFALESLALGGLYISGGVAARSPELVTHQAFADEFHRSDTLGHLLRDIPVYLIKEQDAGLWGAAFLGKQMLS